MPRFPLMIFAAGFGTRMGALTAARPKPLIPVAGRALIDHALDLTRGQDLGPKVVNLHYHGDLLAAHLQGRDLTLSWERDAILDTGGGLKAALPLLGDGPVMTLNSDAIWTGGNPLAALAAGWRGDMGGLLVVGRADQITGRSTPAADFQMDADGRLTRAKGASDGVVYLGAQIVARGPVAAWPETVFSMNRIWDQLIDQGRLFGLLHDGAWCDVGSPEGIVLAEQLLQAADG
jgi:N-acetyl-alpha-D-muramate 1-phosphate uridylyltransferase